MALVVADVEVAAVVLDVGEVVAVVVVVEADGELVEAELIIAAVVEVTLAARDSNAISLVVPLSSRSSARSFQLKRFEMNFGGEKNDKNFDLSEFFEPLPALACLPLCSPLATLDECTSEAANCIAPEPGITCPLNALPTCCVAELG